MEQKRVKLANGIELHVVDEGPRDAPALIFLHGFPESHRTWRHQIAHFSDRFRCIAPDQRGYRGSSKPQEVEAYTPDKLIGDVFQLADALGIGKFTIVGHDWGGAPSKRLSIGYFILLLSIVIKYFIISIRIIKSFPGAITLAPTPWYISAYIGRAH